MMHLEFVILGGRSRTAPDRRPQNLPIVSVSTEYYRTIIAGGRSDDRTLKRTADRHLALRAGDLALITVPGELFSQYAAGFRQASPFPATAVISLANDSVGYLVTDETLAQGGLEAMRASGESLEQPLLEHARLALTAESPVDAPNRWTPVGDPLIGPQPDTDHNCQGPGFPFLLPATADRWLLYFCGWGRRRPDGTLPNTTGVAISDDGGKKWRYHSTHPVIALDRPYDSQGTGSVWVLYENGLYRIYYTAIGEYFPRPDNVETGHGDTIPRIGIAYAESTDGIRWEKPIDRLLIAPRGFDVSPYEYIVSKPCIIRQKTGYTMWVNTFGTAYRVHRLVSPDGIHWDWTDRLGPDGELGTGPPGSFDDHQRSYPTIVREDDELRCWFTGNGFGTTGTGYAASST